MNTNIVNIPKRGMIGLTALTRQSHKVIPTKPLRTCIDCGTKFKGGTVSVRCKPCRAVGQFTW